MAAIRYVGETPGQARKGPVFAMFPRPPLVASGQFDFDSSYPTGGEDVSDIFNQFPGQLLSLWVEQPLSGAQTGKFLKVDYTNKKLLLYTNASPAVEVANASDQSAIVGLRWVAWGY